MSARSTRESESGAGRDARARLATPLASERKPFLLRLDPQLHEALQRWARDELRSLNAQLEFVLREALSRAGRASDRARDGANEPQEEIGRAHV